MKVEIFSNEKLSDDENKRYWGLVKLGRKCFRDSALVVNTAWQNADERKVRTFYQSAVKFADPKLHSNFGLHLLTTSINASQIAIQLNLKDINPLEMGALGWLHDIGTFIAPGDYLRKDLIGSRMLIEIGVRREILAKLPDILAILGLSENIVESLRDVTLSQIIVDVADNLGKYNQDGSLFTVEQMTGYARSQPKRYEVLSVSLPSVKAGLEALNQGKQEFAIELILQEINYLQKRGVNFEVLKNRVWREVHKDKNQKWLVEFSKRYEESKE